MEARDTNQDTGRAHRGRYSKPDKQVGLSHKRGRGAENEELTEHTRKSPRLQENPDRRRRNAGDKLHRQPPRKSPRLQEIRDLNQQKVKQERKRTRSPPRTRTHRCVGQKRPHADRRILRNPKSQNISPSTSRPSADRSPVSTHKRNRDQEHVVETRAKRQKPSGSQAQPSRAVDTDTPTLTSKHLKHLERQIQSKHLSSTEKSVLRQWEFVSMPRSRKIETKSRRTEDTSSSIKTISTTDPRFQQIAVNNGILVPRNSTQPNNFDKIHNYLNRPRESASPSLDEYNQYLFDADTADNEDTLKLAVIGQLKKYNDGSYRSAYNQQFTEYPSNAGFNDGLSTPKPDLIQGINLNAFEPYPVKDQLGGSAVPTPSLYPITLAHMAGEFKRPGGDLIQARGQAAYDAACLVHGRNTARESMGKADLPGTAHVGSFISDGTHITTFTHYATKDASGKIVYHQWPVTDTNIQLGHQSFKTGRRQLRNLQDWTRENSYLLKEELLDNYKLSQAQSNEQPIPEGNECSEYGNDYSSAENSVVVGSESYVLVDRPTQPESLPILEAEAFYVTPHSSDSARSRRHDRLAPHVDMAKRIPKQRNTRYSARLLERRHQEDRE